MSKQETIAQQEEFTVAQTARQMDTLLGNVYALLWAGKLAGRKIDGKWYITGDSIAERLRARDK